MTCLFAFFDKWTAHPEVGDDEHGSGEGRGEHERENGEHDREGNEHGSGGEGRGEHEREGEREHK
ncbi:hypothetical protein F4X10_24170 [Candidatus Poribacteria bacterium]|nr:hypothetical protein [Candidatus Poribacteria bacterium]